MGAISLLLRLLCAVAVSWAAPAAAHTPSESFSSWMIDGGAVHVEFTVPDREAKCLSPSGNDLPSTAVLARYLDRRLGVAASGKACLATHPARSVSSTPGFGRFELDFVCPYAAKIVLRSVAFQDRVATHTNFARVQEANGAVIEQIVTKDDPEIDMSGGPHGSLAEAGLLTFVGMGIWHIFTGVDHMSFMLGLVLISRRLRDLLFVITGFSVGHSLTLALAVTGVLRPDAQFIDALVALTIALIGAEYIGDTAHRPLPVALGLGGLLAALGLAKIAGLDEVLLPPLLLLGAALFAGCYLMATESLKDAGRERTVVTLVFGLIHGFGFAANLLDQELPTARLARLLLGFNVGVEIGQVVVVLTALGVVALLSRLRMTMPHALFGDLASSFLVAEGLYWFVTRSLALA